MSRDPSLAIGQLAQATGVTISTIRYYDELGLVTPVARVGGKRRFAPDTVGRLNFVRRTQAAGFTLDDIKAILDDQAGHWPELVRSQVERLRAKREQLDQMIMLLEEAQRCGCEVVVECPRMEAATFG